MIEPKDGARSRLFIAPAGAWIVLDAGKIASARFTPSTGRISLTLDPASATTPEARVSVETTTKSGRPYVIADTRIVRGAYAIKLSAQPTQVDLTPR